MSKDAHIGYINAINQAGDPSASEADLFTLAANAQILYDRNRYEVDEEMASELGSAKIWDGTPPECLKRKGAEIEAMQEDPGKKSMLVPRIMIGALLLLVRVSLTPRS
jgi:hypothetical protein